MLSKFTVKFIEFGQHSFDGGQIYYLDKIKLKQRFITITTHLYLSSILSKN